jgi:hypothetical protein
VKCYGWHFLMEVMRTVVLTVDTRCYINVLLYGTSTVTGRKRSEDFEFILVCLASGLSLSLA